MILHRGPGRPQKYTPEEWETCRAFSRRGYTAAAIEEATGIPRATIAERRRKESDTRTGDWGHWRRNNVGVRAFALRKNTRRCVHCLQKTVADPCAHCGLPWKAAA